MTKILVYVQHTRLICPTGIGQTIINVLTRLRRCSAVTVLTSREYRVYPSVRSFIEGIDVKILTHRGTRAFMDRLWKYLGMPQMDRMVAPYDWVYHPAESYLPIHCAQTKQAVTIHDTRHWDRRFNHSWISRVLWTIYCRRIAKHADVVFTVSDYSKQEIVRLTPIKHNQITVVGGGVDDIHFSRKRLPSPRKGPYVLVVGGLTALKGGDDVIAVADLLPDIPFVVVGGQRTDPKYLHDLKHHPNIVHEGYVEQEELRAYYQHAICLLFLSQYEGFGLPAAEAMASGTPAIVSDIPALREVVGDTGIIVDPIDYDGIVRTIQSLHMDTSYRRRIITAQRRRAEHFRWHRVTDTIVGVLQ